MLKSYGKYDDAAGDFEFVCLRDENLQFLVNHLRLELKDHNRADIRPHFISRTLVDQDFQHTINSLHFLIKGRAVLRFQGETQELSAGDVFLIGNHVGCTWEYTEPSEELTLLFNVYIGNLDDLFSSLAYPLILHGQEAAVGEADRLFSNRDTCSELGLYALCVRYLYIFLSMSGVELEERISLIKKYGRVFAYITERLSCGLTVTELAEATGYSVGFFTKSFPKDNGVTVKQYVHDKIMSEVEQLLIYSDVSVGSIAEKFGFCEQAYFTRWFKKHKNCTPTEYRAVIRRTTENRLVYRGEKEGFAE